jgi:ribosomal protein S18 acetylase RimI-like enzyme
MPFALRHRDDPTTALSALAGFRVEEERSAAVMATLQGRTDAEMQARFDAGHRAYVARIGDEPAAWGWVATREARIGELDTTVRLPLDERYLWNFVTLPAFRGRGVYPRLLQAIVRAESSSATRFWIAYAPENRASGAGIRKAGFTALAELSFDRQGRAALKSLAPDGARTVGRVLPLEEAAEVTPCWRCVRAGRSTMYCPDGRCQCDYQQPRSGCTA